MVMMMLTPCIKGIKLETVDYLIYREIVIKSTLLTAEYVSLRRLFLR